MILSTLITTLALSSGVTAPGIEPAPVLQAALDESMGEITRADLENGLFVIRMDGDKILRLKVDDRTVYKKGEEVARKEDVLAVGNEVSVTHAEGTASLVSLKLED